MCILYFYIYIVLFALIYVASPQSNAKSLVIHLQQNATSLGPPKVQKSTKIEIPFESSYFSSDLLPSRQLTYPTWGKGKSSTQKCLGRGYVSFPGGYIPNLTNGNSPLKSSTPENLQINVGFGTNWKIAILRLSQTVISAKWPWHPRYRTTTCDLDKLFFTHSTMVYSLMCRIVFCCCRLYISKQSLGIFGSD